MSKLPSFGLFISVGNIKPKLKWFFKPKLFQLNCAPALSLDAVLPALAALGPLERGPSVEGADAVGAPTHETFAADLLVALLVRVGLLVLEQTSKVESTSGGFSDITGMY